MNLGLDNWVMLMKLGNCDEFGLIWVALMKLGDCDEFGFDDWNGFILPTSI